MTTTKPRVPAAWRLMRPGDILASRAPLHRLQGIAAQIDDRQFMFEPSPNGYFVKCVGIKRKPLKVIS